MSEKLSYYQRNKEKIKAKRAAYVIENKEKVYAKNKEWSLSNAERLYAYRKKRYLDNLEEAMWNSAKIRAKNKNLEFSIEIIDIVIPEFCPILGIPIEKGKNMANSPSLDRIDPKLGYTKENIRVISFRANSLKNDGTLEEMQKIVEDLQKRGF